jgi:hypothetical protein
MLSELFRSDEFAKYRKKELAMMTNHVWSLMMANRFEEAKGALEMALRVLKLPSELVNSDDIKLRMKEVMKEFQSNFIRQPLDE